LTERDTEPRRFLIFLKMAAGMGRNSWWLWEVNQRHFHFIVEHVLQAPWSSRLLFCQSLS